MESRKPWETPKLIELTEVRDTGGDHDNDSEADDDNQSS